MNQDPYSAATNRTPSPTLLPPGDSGSAFPPPLDGAETPFPTPTDGSPPPTNHIKDIKVEQDGIQIIVSTRGHLLDVRNVSAGRGSAQFIGTTEDQSLQDVTRVLVQRQGIPSDPLAPNGSGSAGFGNTYGSGYTLRMTKATDDSAVSKGL
jgi:hypothetical protein